ncbi:pseudouridine synthase [Rhabdobacter roseus]
MKRSSLTLPRTDKPQPTARPKEDETRRPFYENVRPGHKKDRRQEEPRGDSYRGDGPRGDGSRPYNERYAKPTRHEDARPSFKRDEKKPFGEKRPFGGPKASFRPATEPGDKADRPRFGRPDHDRSPRPFKRSEDHRDFKKPRGESKPYEDRGHRISEDDKPRYQPPGRPSDRDEKPRPYASARPERGVHPFEDKRKPDFGKKKDDEDRRRVEPAEEGAKRRVGRFESAPRYDFSRYEDKKPPVKRSILEDDQIRLNRYISNSGICSRREADELIASGQISVNGKTITEMGYKVKPSDVVKYGKKALNPERMVYILINKPKDYITTTDDPEERKTVLDLVAGACQERVYPVGRLDRNTTGLLLLTNDGELAEKLTHPSGGIKKVYQAELDKPMTTEDFEALQKGLELEDGFIKPDEVGIVTPDAMVVGLEIHSGRNRIVRRMFEHLGYEVKKLDRTVFAGLNKKELPRGKWRFLTEKEVVRLKYML